MTADTTPSHAPQNVTSQGRGKGGMRFGASEKAEARSSMRHSAIRSVFVS